MIALPRCLVLAGVFMLLSTSSGCDVEPSEKTPTSSQRHAARQAEPAPPLPAWNEQTYTQQVLPPERRAAFYKRRFTDFYREHGQTDAPWHNDAAQLLDDACDYLAYNDFSFYAHPRRIASRSQIARRLRGLQKQGCDEPLVLYLGKLCKGFRDRQGRKAFMEYQTAYRHWSVEINQKPRYTLSILAVDHIVMSASEQISDISKSWVRGWANRNTGPFALVLQPEIELTEADEVEFARLFDYYAEDMSAETAKLFLQNTPQPVEEKRWLTHTLRGIAYIHYAWAERGGGVYAKQVKLKAWPRFFSRLNQAEKEFSAALDIYPRRAEPAVRMITVAMGLGNKQPYDWFEKSVALDPYDAKAYNNGIWSHRIQWARDPDTVLRVARKAFASNDYHTGVPDWGKYAIDILIKDYGSKWWAEHHEAVWDDLTTYLDRRAADPAPTSNAAYYFQEGFKLAHAAGRTDDRWDYYQKLQQHHGRIRKPYLFNIDQQWVIDRMHAEREAEVLALLTKTDLLRTGDQAGQLIALIDETLPRAQHKKTIRHLQDLRRSAEWNRAYGGYESIDLLENGYEGWWLVRGDWAQGAGDGVSGTYSRQDELQMIPAFRAGTRYRAELSLEVPENYFSEDFGCVGLILDPTMNRSGYEQRWIGLTTQRNSSIFIQDPQNQAEDDQLFGTGVKGQAFTIRLERWDQSLRVYLNDALVVERYDLQAPWPSQGLLGIGAWHPNRNGFHYTFKSLVVKPLKTSPFETPVPSITRPPFSR